MKFIKKPKDIVIDDGEDGIQILMRSLPSAVASYVECIPEEILCLTTDYLEERIPNNIRLLLRRLRTTFWLEADRAMTTGRAFASRAVYEGLCDRSFFYKEVVGMSYRLAYILRRPPGEQVLLEETLLRGLEIQRQILEMQAVDDQGKTDTKLLGIQTKIIDNVHNRLKGTPVSRAQIHTHTTTSIDPIKARLAGATKEELKERLVNLEKGES